RERCPHCGSFKPVLTRGQETDVTDGDGRGWKWVMYSCSACLKVVTVGAPHPLVDIKAEFPAEPSLDPAIPDKVANYLRQALNSLAGSPDGAVMLCGSAVDAMLAELQDPKLRQGKVEARIDLAVEQGLITPAMARWAHYVRRESSNPRHVKVRK